MYVIYNYLVYKIVRFIVVASIFSQCLYSNGSMTYVVAVLVALSPDVHYDIKI